MSFTPIVPITRTLTEEEILQSRVEWKPGVEWRIGEITYYDGKFYVAEKTITQAEFSTIDLSSLIPNDPAWTEITDSNIKVWQSINTYQYYKFSEVNPDPIGDPWVEITLDLYRSNSLEKIQAAYKPTSNMPGKNFAQLMRGIEYPGVKVTGVDFAEGYRIPTGPLKDYDDSLLEYSILNLDFNETQQSIVSPTTKIFGVGSGSFNSGRYLQAVGAPLTAMGQGDFTIEFYFRLHELTTESTQVFLDLRNFRVDTISINNPGDGSGDYVVGDELEIVGEGPTRATFNVSTLQEVKCELVNAGTNYVVGDYVKVTGGTSSTAVSIQITEVGINGEILNFEIANSGNYTVAPSNPVATTDWTDSGHTIASSGINATFNLVWGIKSVSAITEVGEYGSIQTITNAPTKLTATEDDFGATVSITGHTFLNTGLVLYKNERNQLCLSVSNTLTAIISGGSITKNIWQFVTLVRIGTLLKLFLNGTEIGSLVIASLTNFSANSMTIGAAATGHQPMYGNIDELRLTKGVARYSNNFTLPTSAFPRDIYGDPQFNRITFLSGFETLNADPTAFDESTKGVEMIIVGSNKTIIDSSANSKIVTLYGDIDLTSRENWGKCLETNLGYATVGENDEFAFDLDDFTIEFWHKGSVQSGTILDTSDKTEVSPGVYESTNNGVKISFDLNDMKYKVYVNDSLILSSLTISDFNEWRYISVEQKNHGMYLYVNGVLQAISNEILSITGRNLTIGRDCLYEDAGNSQIDDLRITRGIARHVQSKAIDIEMYSSFTDAELGTRPQEIITVGGGFVDSFSSHAPEELMPGITYDSANIRVFTIPGDDVGSDGQSLPITLQGFNVVYPQDYTYTSLRFEADNLIVYSVQQGKLLLDVDYVVDRLNKIISVLKPLSIGDTVLIYSYDNGGGRRLANSENFADGVQTEFTAPYTYDVDNIVLVLQNGIRVETGITIESSEVGHTQVVFDTAPSEGDQISIHVYGNPSPTINQPYCFVSYDRHVVSDDQETTYAMSNPIVRNGIKEPCVVVEYNGRRLRPPVMTYATGDGSENIFEINLVGVADLPEYEFPYSNVNPYLLPDSDYVVYIDGVLQNNGTDYVLETGIWSPGGTRSVIFSSAPPVDAAIEIAIMTFADYTISGSNVVLDPLIIDENLSDPINFYHLAVGDIIEITHYVNNDYTRTQTLTYIGGTDSAVSVPIGFDGVVFDSSLYDETSTIIVTTPVFTMPTTVQQGEYLWVTLNGQRLHDTVNYLVSGDQLILNPNLGVTPTDIVVVSLITENLATPATAFRIWTDMLQNTSYYAIPASATTYTTEDINIGDDIIHLRDISGIFVPVPASGKRGVLFINGERITYLYVDTAAKTVSGLMRGTWGTPVIDTHEMGSRVESASVNELLPGSPHVTTWYKDGSLVGDTWTWPNTGGLQDEGTSNIGTYLTDSGAILL